LTDINKHGEEERQSDFEFGDFEMGDFEIVDFENAMSLKLLTLAAILAVFTISKLG